MPHPFFSVLCAKHCFLFGGKINDKKGIVFCDILVVFSYLGFFSEGTHAYIANFNLLTWSYFSQSPSADSVDVTHRFLRVSGVLSEKKKNSTHDAAASVQRQS